MHRGNFYVRDIEPPTHPTSENATFRVPRNPGIRYSLGANSKSDYLKAAMDDAVFIALSESRILAEKCLEITDGYLTQGVKLIEDLRMLKQKWQMVIDLNDKNFEMMHSKCEGIEPDRGRDWTDDSSQQVSTVAHRYLCRSMSGEAEQSPRYRIQMTGKNCVIPQSTRRVASQLRVIFTAKGTPIPLMTLKPMTLLLWIVTTGNLLLPL